MNASNGHAAKGGVMAGTILDQSTIPVIRGRFEGDILEPGDGVYDEARTIFNAMIDRRPRLIVRLMIPAS